LPDYGTEVIYQSDSDFTGQDSFAFHADDGGAAPTGGPSDTATVTADVQPVAGSTASVEFEISESLDDAYARPEYPYNSTSEPFLYVGTATSGMRFTNINIPPKSRIVSAHLVICLPYRDFDDVVEGVIQAEASGDAADFAGTSRHVCQIAKTQANVPWTWTPAGYANQDWETHTVVHAKRTWAWCESPDICQVIQEVVDRPDWSAGNAIAIIYGCDKQEGQNIQFYSVDNNEYPYAYNPARLKITFVY
jgi:hypothetical protein